MFAFCDWFTSGLCTVDFFGTAYWRPSLKLNVKPFYPLAEPETRSDNIYKVLLLHRFISSSRQFTTIFMHPLTVSALPIKEMSWSTVNILSLVPSWIPDLSLGLFKSQSPPPLRFVSSGPCCHLSYLFLVHFPLSYTHVCLRVCV